MTGFGAEADSVSSILKGIVCGPDSMLEKLLKVGEFQQATQLMTTVVTVLNSVSSQELASDSADINDRVEVGTHTSLALEFKLEYEFWILQFSTKASVFILYRVYLGPKYSDR